MCTVRGQEDEQECCSIAKSTTSSYFFCAHIYINILDRFVEYRLPIKKPLKFLGLELKLIVFDLKRES